MKKLYNRIDGEVLKQQMLLSNEKRVTLSFYKYALLPNPAFFRDYFYDQMDQLQVKGRIYVASEGINAQVSVPEKNFDQFKDALNDVVFLRGVRLNIAIEDDGKSFYKLKIKIRPKIVADGLDDSSFDVTDRGIHLSAKAFNDITDQNETLVIDMRNHYESEVGHFKGALTPDVETFRDSLPIVEGLLDEHRDKNIVMYCTGGIRCEKASAYFKHKGFEHVYQLDGGIIEYARQAEKEGLENKFIGKNFVFDERMGERISSDIIAKCHQCGGPCDNHVNCANDACHILFLQCPSCAEKFSDCCSTKCQNFNALPEEQRNLLKASMEFNGTKFGKGRYKAHHAGGELD